MIAINITIITIDLTALGYLIIGDKSCQTKVFIEVARKIVFTLTREWFMVVTLSCKDIERGVENV